MRAVQLTEFGGPEVVAVRDVPDPRPGPGRLLVHVSRAGVNYADSLLRENAYLGATALPLIPGGEVVGRTEDGRRVAAMMTAGGYAERAVVPEHQAFAVPDELDDVAAVALLAQGLTAWWLIHRTAGVTPGDSVVVHAGAGGVGSLAVQLARNAGAGRVIATASTPEKRELVRSLGADATVDPATEDLTAALRAANEGRPVDVVLEMIGGRVTGQSIDALAPFGRLAFYGMASLVEPDAVSPRALQRQSATVSGFWLMHAFARPDLLARAYADLAAQVVGGELRIVSGGEFPMSEVREVHAALRGRRTTGKVVLDPSR
ncbi:NADPH2:quinone reductase [Hamadaea flava]|uniref:Zinc-binding alcohol dehydrogenase family protein n=1 Tax=Hamadaea flava TaxID=1742688 RepID=A0ABV8LGN4_9ACTN|nr:zinc-binding dehydrogenase [Hamadaea flava]MCP2324367.1 NADPH2:quinone reductase [Hamadaea flava]